MTLSEIAAPEALLSALDQHQRDAVRHEARRLLIVAGAGSGKTEVMARRVAWWVRVDGVPQDQIVAFTFTEAAADELKFRIRRCLEETAAPGETPRLGGMYVGTIHGFCLKALRDFASDEFYMYDVVDDGGRMSLVEQGYNGVLALPAFENVMDGGKFQSLRSFLRAYDLLNEYDRLDVALPHGPLPDAASEEGSWCRAAILRTEVGTTNQAKAFGKSVGRYYAYLRARRFLDFSTIQSEVTRRLRTDAVFRGRLRDSISRVVVDEVQDINPVQMRLIRSLVGDCGFLTAVGDHRQAIYAFRGGRVDLMGDLHSELERSSDGYVQELPANYRSTPRIIDLANRWSSTINDRAGMANPSMAHRRHRRRDVSAQHVAQMHFADRKDEAEWIANTVCRLVKEGEGRTLGAAHDQGDGMRGLTHGDVAILVRTSADVRTYQNALERRGIPAVVRGGPDLFSQPEVLLFLGALGVCGGVTEFWGSHRDRKGMPSRVRAVLNVDAKPKAIVSAAVRELRRRGVAVPARTDERLLTLCRAIRHRLESSAPQPDDLASLRCSRACRQWLARARQPRRIFPQRIFHWLLREAGLHSWRSTTNGNRLHGILFHVGQLSSFIKGIETAGWTPADSLKWQVIALINWGAGAARAPETPLLTNPDAVTVTTIHSAKGLEFAAVFVADICAQRFPNNKATQRVVVPFGSDVGIDTEHLSDNSNHDNERRLMYVALTRAERYLFLTASGRSKSKFFREVGQMVGDLGGLVADGTAKVEVSVDYRRSAVSREDRLMTSFSDLRYFLECPQDYFLRRVLGFNPTIGQEFGYGRGLHNLLRVVHEQPRHWAELASDRRRLREAVGRLVDRGLFYLRYTVGAPLDNLRRSAIEGIVDYVGMYRRELAVLKFEPEREFETFIEEQNMLIAGAIDVIRLDDPPRVSIVDFKSGDAQDETGSGLNRDLMALQLAIYGMAAREELEYDPRQGLIRYVGEEDRTRREVRVDLHDRELARVREVVAETGRSIRERDFDHGPTDRDRDRCARCDFLEICPRPEARVARQRLG